MAARFKTTERIKNERQLEAIALLELVVFVFVLSQGVMEEHSGKAGATLDGKAIGRRILGRQGG